MAIGAGAGLDTTGTMGVFTCSSTAQEEEKKKININVNSYNCCSKNMA